MLECTAIDILFPAVDLLALFIHQLRYFLFAQLFGGYTHKLLQAACREEQLDVRPFGVSFPTTLIEIHCSYIYKHAFLISVAAGTGKAAKAAWLAMAFGLAVGVILCGFFTYLIIRQR